MTDYTRYSYWLETCDDDLTPRAPLDGPIDVDVAILGAGFTGLWTAYYLLQREPSLRIAIIEQRIAGFGASGRNGGWCSAGFPVSLARLAELYGNEVARRLQLAMFDTVDEVGRVLEAEHIDAHFHQGGTLRVARGAGQVPLVEHAMDTYRKLDLQEHYQLLDAEQTAERVRITDARAAIFSPHGAAVHPGRLVRGLARAVERRGATIYEQTTVTDYRAGYRPALVTTRGDVRARTIVLAGEAYLSRLRKLHRQLIPVYSLIVLTEPLSAATWDAIGWHDRELISSNRYTVDYLSRTADGRLLFGGRGAPYHFGSKIADAYDRHEPTHAMLRDQAVAWFPVLRHARFTHAWGGPLGMPRDWMPTMTYDPSTGIATARGYTGQGVATANLSGRVLADLITGTASDLTDLPMVGHVSPNWEPEPLRWLGVRYTQTGYMRIDDEAQRTGRAPTGGTLTEWLGRH